MCVNYLGDLLQARFWFLCLGGAWESAFLASSLLRLMLLIHGYPLSSEDLGSRRWGQISARHGQDEPDAQRQKNRKTVIHTHRARGWEQRKTRRQKVGQRKDRVRETRKGKREKPNERWVRQVVHSLFVLWPWPFSSLDNTSHRLLLDSRPLTSLSLELFL